jgi:rhomboid protease GluP
LGITGKDSSDLWQTVLSLSVLGILILWMGTRRIRRSRSENGVDHEPIQLRDEMRRFAPQDMRAVRLMVNTLIFLNVVISLGFFFLLPESEASYEKVGLKLEYLVQGEYWRIFTYMWFHGGLLHLFMNMTALQVTGFLCGRFFGMTPTLLIYIFSGLFAGLAMIFGHPKALGVGASGAIFGLLGAISVFLFRVQAEPNSALDRLKKNVWKTLILNLFISLLPGISFSAHLGGFIFGVIAGMIFMRRSETAQGPSN